MAPRRRARRSRRTGCSPSLRNSRTSRGSRCDSYGVPMQRERHRPPSPARGPAWRAAREPGCAPRPWPGGGSLAEEAGVSSSSLIEFRWRGRRDDGGRRAHARWDPAGDTRRRTVDARRRAPKLSTLPRRRATRRQGPSCAPPAGRENRRRDGGTTRRDRPPTSGARVVAARASPRRGRRRCHRARAAAAPRMKWAKAAPARSDTCLSLALTGGRAHSGGVGVRGRGSGSSSCRVGRGGGAAGDLVGAE